MVIRRVFLSRLLSGPFSRLPRETAERVRLAAVTLRVIPGGVGRQWI